MLVGMKDTRAARVGDTWHRAREPVPALPGFRPAKSMVFAGIFPLGAAGFEQLHAAMERLTLNDASVAVRRENSNALGAGFRCGFLGLLHMDVFRQRLEQEHGASVIVTAPTVPVSQTPRRPCDSLTKTTGRLVNPRFWRARAWLRACLQPRAPCRRPVQVRVQLASGEERELQNPSEFPTHAKVAAVWEPTVRATIVTPAEHVGAVMTLAQARRGELQEHAALSPGRALLRYRLPLAELGGDFYDELKSASSGYASFDYEEGEYRRAGAWWPGRRSRRSGKTCWPSGERPCACRGRGCC